MCKPISIEKMRELFARAEKAAEIKNVYEKAFSTYYHFLFPTGEWATFDVANSRVEMRVTRRTDTWVEDIAHVSAIRQPTLPPL